MTLPITIPIYMVVAFFDDSPERWWGHTFSHLIGPFDTLELAVEYAKAANERKTIPNFGIPSIQGTACVFKATDVAQPRYTK